MKPMHVLNLIRAYQNYYLESQIDGMAGCHHDIQAWLREGAEIQCYEFTPLTDLSKLNLLPTDHYILIIGARDSMKTCELLQKRLFEVIDEDADVITYTDLCVSNPQIDWNDPTSYLYVISPVMLVR